MQKTCKQCSVTFEITDVEAAYLKARELVLPEACPACRRRQRLRFRNFFNLYHRTCNLTGKKIISMYDTDVPFPVYDLHEWWSDKWDGKSYGLTWDRSRPILDHIADLHTKVPRMAIMNTSSENTDYCNLCFYSRNCYLVHGCVNSEDCLYGHIVWRSKNCVDCLYVYKCELCTECIDCLECTRLAYSRDCGNCHDSLFLVHCNGCRDCFGCVGLKNKQYCIFNEQHSAEEYKRKLAEFNTGSRTMITAAERKIRELIGHEIVKHYHGFGCENVTGDYLYNSKNIIEGYDVKRCEDSGHIATCEGFVNCYDCNFSGTDTRESYNCITVEGEGLIGCHTCLQNNSNLVLCDNCYSCQACIGCVGLKKQRYCIFNTQYDQAEYIKLAAELVKQLKADGQYGAFFPISLSPFAHNETIAQFYFPLTESQASAAGERWKEDRTQTQYLGPVHTPAEDVRNETDVVTTSILRCTETGKFYKILPQELAHYRERNLPLPTLCPEARLARRIAERNPRKLWNRQCAKCRAKIETTYAPERPEIVYCERCYLETVY